VLGTGFLVSPSSGLPLDSMFLEQPPERLAILVLNAPLALQIITRILHSRDVSLAHRDQQTSPCLSCHARSHSDWLVLLEQVSQTCLTIPFPPPCRLDRAVADQRRTVLQALRRSTFQ